MSTASFVPGTQKIPFVILAIRKVDALKILLMVLWETKSLETKRYIALSRPIEEVGKMLGGWSGQLHRQNSPEQSGEKG
ncbi:MAG: four helix bundle protein [Candidatus Paceibacterota bacterium]